METGFSNAFNGLLNLTEALNYDDLIDLSSLSHAGICPLAPSSNGFVCSDSRCNCGRSFHRRHELIKHLNRVNRPYICSYKDCTSSVRAFATRWDCERHESEQHGKPGTGTVGIYCPVQSCKRHTRAFTRRSNLKSHMECRHHQSPPAASHNTKKLRPSAPTLAPLLPAGLSVGSAASGSVASGSVASAAFRSRSPSLSTATTASSRASAGLPEVSIVAHLRTEQKMHIRCAEELENAIQAYKRSHQSMVWPQQQQQQQGDINPAVMLNGNINGIDGWDCDLDTMDTIDTMEF